MALTNCPDCGHRVSTAAYACPNCGRRIGAIARQQEGCFLQSLNFGCGAALFILVLLLLLVALA
jgi:DNA-directed RNA polymerase subunit RPC12/RpoP